MNKSKITGWKHVFSFTFQQTAKSKSFKSSTIFLGIVLFIGMIAINVGSSLSEKNDENTHKPVVSTQVGVLLEFAHTIYYKDETGLGFLMKDVEGYVNETFAGSTFIQVEETHETFVTTFKNEDQDSAYLYLGMDGNGIDVQLYLPASTTYSEENTGGFVSSVVDYLINWKEQAVALDDNQKNFLMADIQTSVTTNDNKSFGETMVEMYVPMMMCLVLYMCIIMYGQMVGTSVATEKSSRVMELLLTSIRPLAIIVGKVMSMMVLSLVQLGIWLVLLVVGNGIGTVLGQKIYPNYSNIVIELLKEFDLLTIFSPLRILCALVVFILGFTFYCTLAGLMGATVNRGEDLSSAMSVYSTVSVIGFMLAYIPSILGTLGTGIQQFVSIFPLSSPFILPAKILTGELPVGMIILGVLILFVVVITFVIVVAKIYEIVILYNGTKVGLRQIKDMMRVAKAEGAK